MSLTCEFLDMPGYSDMLGCGLLLICFQPCAIMFTWIGGWTLDTYSTVLQNFWFIESCGMSSFVLELQSVQQGLNFAMPNSLLFNHQAIPPSIRSNHSLIPRPRMRSGSGNETSQTIVHCFLSSYRVCIQES